MRMWPLNSCGCTAAFILLLVACSSVCSFQQPRQYFVSASRSPQLQDRYYYSSASPAQRPLSMMNDDNSRISADNKDFISNIFAKFLPKPEDVGLKRATNPENFPCVKDEFASPLAQDNTPELKLVRQTLAKTNLESRPLQLVYDANKDGWSATAFHSKVDRKGPAVVLCRSSTSGGVYGGYNPTGWVNLGEYRGSIAAFLFTFSGGDTTQRPLKLAKISGAGLAQIDDGFGPKFGAEGLTILLEKTRPKFVRCKLGLYYERLPNGKNSMFANMKLEDELADLKVFVGVYAKDEKIPYSDALPFALN